MIVMCESSSRERKFRSAAAEAFGEDRGFVGFVSSNNVRVRGLPFSSTAKAFLGRPTTGLPESSVTTTGTSNRSVRVWIVLPRSA